MVQAVHAAGILNFPLWNDHTIWEDELRRFMTEASIEDKELVVMI